MADVDFLQKAAQTIETVATHPAGAGAVGGAIFSARFMPGTTKMEKFINVVAATGTAFFFAPVLADVFGVKGERWGAAIAVLVGFIGIGVLGMLWEILKAWGKQFEHFPIVERLLAFIPWGKK